VCGRLVDKSGLRLRIVLRANLADAVELDASRVELREERALALEELRHLALNLASLLDHHLLEELLTQHRDRHDRTGATATLVRGGLVRTVVALVAHVCHSTFVLCVCQATCLRLWTTCG
jgi:hypothetical protein